MQTIEVAPAGGVRRVHTLSRSELRMLLRFAVLRELEEEAHAAAGERPTLAALDWYTRSGAFEELDCWWPLLRQFARACLDLRRTQ